MGNTRPECFLRGLKFSDKKIRGLKFLGENLRGLKSISKFDQFFFQNFHFLEDTDPNIWRFYILLKNQQLHYTTMMRKYNSLGVWNFLVKLAV